MDKTDENKQNRKSGAAEILYDNEWDEVLRIQGKDKYQRYIVPENGGVISVRFTPEDAGKEVRIFKESR